MKAKHLHILGLSGTFMSALAILASELGYYITGNDAQCYPPVSDLLKAKGINWIEGYEDASLALQADLVIVGNTVKRGTPVLEAVLNAAKPYTSGPQWLAEQVLARYKVMAVSGTHGKTTTTSMLAFILDQAGLKPGFLIGGLASDFQTSARLGEGDWFVIEADEYDSAFFDKRPKFMHYRPQLAILNNLEFDHADIYTDLAAIQQQFHYFLRTIPANGLVLAPKADKALNEVLAKGVYSQVQHFSLSADADWSAELLDEAGQAFRIYRQGEQVAELHWSLIGRFNVENALAAIAASAAAGVSPEIAARALERFTPVKRRLELRGEAHGIRVYDDFAHHPTAISKTIEALVASGRHKRVLAVLEFASNTMRSGVQAALLEQSVSKVDQVFCLRPNGFNLEGYAQSWTKPYQILDNSQAIVEAVQAVALPGDAVLVMSNRGFDNIHQRLLQALEKNS